MRYDALASLPAGHSVRNSSMVRGLNEAANHMRASRRRGSRRISYRWRISLTSSKVAVGAVAFIAFTLFQISDFRLPIADCISDFRWRQRNEPQIHVSILKSQICNLNSEI